MLLHSFDHFLVLYKFITSFLCINFKTFVVFEQDLHNPPASFLFKKGIEIILIMSYLSSTIEVLLMMHRVCLFDFFLILICAPNCVHSLMSILRPFDIFLLKILVVLDFRTRTEESFLVSYYPLRLRL